MITINLISNKPDALKKLNQLLAIQKRVEDNLKKELDLQDHLKRKIGGKAMTECKLITREQFICTRLSVFHESQNGELSKDALFNSLPTIDLSAVEKVCEAYIKTQRGAYCKTEAYTLSSNLLKEIGELK